MLVVERGLVRGSPTQGQGRGVRRQRQIHVRVISDVSSGVCAVSETQDLFKAKGYLCKARQTCHRQIQRSYQAPASR